MQTDRRANFAQTELAIFRQAGGVQRAFEHFVQHQLHDLIEPLPRSQR